MNDFLNSLKADLLDRRLLPILALVGALVVAAITYAALSGGGSASTPESSSTAPAQPAGIAVKEKQPGAAQAVAETTSGARVQRRGLARNPFAPLPGLANVVTVTGSSSSSTSSSSTSGGASKGSGETGGTGSNGESTPPPSKSTTPAKPKTVYDVSLLFGEVQPGTAPGAAQLTPYEHVKLLQAFPSATQPLVVFRGVTKEGKAASFTIVGETILHGSAPCLPSPTQCQEINLKPSQTEQLEYLTAGGQVVTYELRVVGIAAKEGSAKAGSVSDRFSRAGREVLESVGLLSVPGMRVSPTEGVLSFTASAD
jgi:hypothetical protein